MLPNLDLREEVLVRFQIFKILFVNKRNVIHLGASFQISLNPCKKYQKIIGFGGALTDSSAWVASCLSEGAKKNFLNSYFHCEKGIGYDVLRIPLGGSDYSLNLYTYNDSPEPDPELKAFALNEMDTKYKVGF